MTAAADVRFKLNTGAEIPALGLGMSMPKKIERLPGSNGQ